MPISSTSNITLHYAENEGKPLPDSGPENVKTSCLTMPTAIFSGTCLLPNSKVSNTSLPECAVSAILPYSDVLPVQDTSDSIPQFSSQTTPEPDNPREVTEIVTVAEVYEPKSNLSCSASEWLPSTIPPVSKPYPPNCNKYGVEWSVSDDAWMAIQYGNEDTAVVATNVSAKPDIDKITKLKPIEILLPASAVFDDKVLPSLTSPIEPNKTFTKEYFMDLHMSVRSYGTYNYAGAKVELKHSPLNIQLFREKLQDYDDTAVISYLQYGFPIGLSQDFFLEPSTKNHTSSYQYYSWIDKFLAKGIKLAECAGPWTTPPLDPIMISPMMTADKDKGSRRAVFDASFGDFSLNQNTPQKEYLGEEYDFTFPSVLDLADLIVKTGQGCLLWKRDLSRWFLQIPVDPGDYDKLGFIWRGQFWIFTAFVWGTRHAGYSGQRVASAILFIFRNLGPELANRLFQALVYMDDFAGCELGDIAHIAFNALGRLLKELGVRESVEKASSPSTTMRFLGVEFDTEAMCMRIDEERRLEIQSLTLLWSRKTVATKQELQSILGKLIWVSKVVRFSRCFVSRLISLLKTLKFQSQKTTIPGPVKLDFAWWHRFLKVFNGVELIIPSTVFCSVLGDACPMGGGAWNEQAAEYFSQPFPLLLCQSKYGIHLKEFWVLILAARVWGHLWSGRRVAFYCDNEACVQTINHQKPSDQALQACLREFFYHACHFKFQPVLLRITSEANDLADFLSRNHNENDIDAKFISRGISNMKPVKITDDMFTFVGDW